MVEKDFDNYRQSPSLLKQIATVLLVLFLVMGIAGIGFVVYSVNQAAQTAKGIVSPVGDLWRQLAVEATPVILPDSLTIVREINQLSNLETASYTLQKVMVAERNTDVLWGTMGESMVFVAVGEVVAGIDLSQLKEGDLQVQDPETVVVHLPPAEVLHHYLNEEQSEVLDRDTGLFASMDANLESQVREEGLNAILEDAYAQGILTEAETNAEESLRTFLNNLGFKSVVFVDEPPPPAPPYQPTRQKGVIIVTPLSQE